MYVHYIMELDDKFLVKADTCAQQNHMIRELESFSDVPDKVRKNAKPFMVKISKDDIKMCSEFDVTERRRQENDMLEVLSGLESMDKDLEMYIGNRGLESGNNFGVFRGFVPTNVYDEYSIEDMMSEVETLDPLGYDARGEKVPMKVKFITPEKANTLKVDECSGDACDNDVGSIVEEKDEPIIEEKEQEKEEPIIEEKEQEKEEPIIERKKNKKKKKNKRKKNLS